MIFFKKADSSEEFRKCSFANRGANVDQIEDDDELFGGVRNESEFLQKKLQVYAEYNFALDVENQPKCQSVATSYLLRSLKWWKLLAIPSMSII